MPCDLRTGEAELECGCGLTPVSLFACSVIFVGIAFSAAQVYSFRS